MRYLSKIILLLLANSICIAGTIDPSQDDSQYIDYAQKYNSVFRIITKKDNKITSSSSCVAIQPKWILTAAHIFNNRQAHNTYIIINNKHYIISKIFIQKQFDIDKVGHSDIALGQLSEEINIPIRYPALYLEKNELNKVADIVGWGVTGTFSTGARLDDSKNRAGTNRISGVSKDLLMCDVSRKDDRSPLEFLISHGDSGGGLFIDGKLAGINSLVFCKDGKTDSSWTDESGHTRVSLFVDWIDSTIKENQ